MFEDVRELSAGFGRAARRPGTLFEAISRARTVSTSRSRGKSRLTVYRAPTGCSAAWAKTVVSGPSEILRIGREK